MELWAFVRYVALVVSVVVKNAFYKLEKAGKAAKVNIIVNIYFLAV